MKKLQFLTDTAIAPEDLAGIKGGKRFEVVQKSAATGSVLMRSAGSTGSKTVLYNGRVYSLNVNSAKTAAMVVTHDKDTCVEW
jgi:hypothetical protein